jgi:hypothetical protein
MVEGQEDDPTDCAGGEKKAMKYTSADTALRSAKIMQE